MCQRRDLNPHALRQTILDRSCMPISPLWRFKKILSIFCKKIKKKGRTQESAALNLSRYLNQWGGGTRVSIVLKMMLKANMASGIHHGLRIGAIKLQKVIFLFIDAVL